MIATAFVLRAQIDNVVLSTWIEAGWLAPAPGPEFSEMDVARAQLISDLAQDLGVNDEGISVALDLIDKVHGVRRVLRELLDAVRTQPAETQDAVFSALRLARASH